MSLQNIESYITESLENVQRLESLGYSLFFYGNDHILPFVSIAKSDNEYDGVSNLNRDGVFRVNIGVSKETLNRLFNDPKKEWDYTKLNSFMPHPHYSAQHFTCILNPVEEKLEETITFVSEAHLIAKKRYDKKKSNKLKTRKRI